MRKTHLHAVIVTAVFILMLAIVGANLPAAALVAQQSGNSSTNMGNTNAQGTNTNTYGQGTTGSTAGQGSSVPQQSNQNAGQTAQPAQSGTPGTAGPESTTTFPGNANQTAADTGRTGGFPWGWVILSFIAGLAIGALAFRGSARTVREDRFRDRDDDDFRRSA